jgi:hypothetical protein
VLLGTRGKTSLKQLQQDMLLEESTFYRVKSAANKFVKPFGFEVVTDKQSDVSFSGDEIAIRMFLYALLTDSYQSIEWPFERFTQDEMTSLLDWNTQHYLTQNSNTKNSLIYFMYAIMFIRTGLVDNDLISDEHDIEIMRYLQDKKDFTDVFSKDISSRLNPEYVEQERLLFNFFTRIFISDLIPPQNKFDLGAEFLKLNQNPNVEL